MVAVLIPIIGGCSSPLNTPIEVPIRSQEGQGSSAWVSADWNDLEAAVIVGTGSIRAVVTGWSADGPRRRRFEFKHFEGQTGWLSAERGDDPPSDEADAEPPVTIALVARFGRFSDSAMEDRLLRATIRRLTQLRGVEFAPIE